MTTTIALCSSKGGTAKTTSTILLGTALARAGHSVLVYDADPQGSATAWADLADETDTPYRSLWRRATLARFPKSETSTSS